MFVEVVRLFIVLALTALGYAVGNRLYSSQRAGEIAPLIGLVLGCGVGYVLGGVVGRTLDRAFGVVEEKVGRSEPGRLFAGTLGAVIGAGLGGVTGFPFFFILDWYWAYPVVALLMWILGSLGYRVAGHRSEDLLALAGLSSRPLVKASRYGTSDTNAYLVDTSALIDGRLLDVARSGFLNGSLLVAPFVLEELQGIADSGDVNRRRRGRRGLEVLAVLSEMPTVDLHVLDDSVPEHEHVDAKLVSLARHLRVSLITTDGNLQRVAELQGISVLNPNRLATALKPAQLPGDQISIGILREGDQDGQGVGYLDDGTMVVVEGAAARVGKEVTAKITSATQTSIGRMLFATADNGDEASGLAEGPAGEVSGAENSGSARKSTAPISKE